MGLLDNPSAANSPLLRAAISAQPHAYMPPPAAVLGVMKDPNHASEFHERLVKWINDYNDNLDSAHEVGVQLVNFGQNVTIRLEDIGYWNPSLMSFSGVREDTHEPVELIQHVTQISILLTSLSRTNPLEPKKRIGFEAPETDPQALENV